MAGLYDLGTFYQDRAMLWLSYPSNRRSIILPNRLIGKLHTRIFNG